MLTQQPRLSNSTISDSFIRQTLSSDKHALWFLAMAMSYLMLGLIFGVLGGFQYLLPTFLQDKLSFAKVRPLHVYLVISWIFCGAQAGLYYYLPRFCNKPLYWQKGVLVHLILQAITSASIVVAFFGGYFG